MIHTIWHQFRRTDLVAALWDCINCLETRCGHLRHENALLVCKCETYAAQLEASRIQHAKALQRVDSLEVALEHAYGELQANKRIRRKERRAARMWITRTVQPRITVN